MRLPYLPAKASTTAMEGCGMHSVAVAAPPVISLACGCMHRRVFMCVFMRCFHTCSIRCCQCRLRRPSHFEMWVKKSKGGSRKQRLRRPSRRQYNPPLAAAAAAAVPSFSLADQGADADDPHRQLLRLPGLCLAQQGPLAGWEYAGDAVCGARGAARATRCC